MIWFLLKRDPAWRWATVLTLVSFAICVIWHFLVGKAGIESSLIFVSAFAFLPASAAMIATTEQNETRFLAALPITVRQVYLARMLSMLGLLWFPVAMSAAGAAALPNPAAPVATLVAFVSVLTLVMARAHSTGVRGIAIPGRWISMLTFPWLTGAGLVPAAGRLSAESRTFLAFLLLCWLGSAAIFVRTWLTVPKSFQAAPLKALPVAARRGTPSGSRGPGIPWIPVLRSVFRWNGVEFLLLFVVMMTGSFRPYYLFFFAGAWASARPRVRWLFALPVPRRWLLAAILLPITFTFAAGYLVSVHLPSFPAPYERGISVRASQQLPGWSHYRQEPDCKTLNVLPSLEFWIPAKNGSAPLIQSPWGETFRPSVFHESGFDIFNPYAVGCANSERFLDWQFQRATSAVYGRPIPRRKNEGWYLLDGYVVVTSLRTQVVMVGAMMGFAMFCMIVTLLGDWHRFRRVAHPVRVVILSLAAAVGFAALMLDAGNKLILTQWIAWALPPSLSGAVAVLIVVLAILFWVLDSLFRQVELTDKPGLSAL
jgi:hypothetical protein